MKLTYTGTTPIVFTTGGVGAVEPGQTFTVPDRLAERFTRRPDIEPAKPPKHDKSA